MKKFHNNKGFATVFVLMMMTFLFFSMSITVNANYSLHTQTKKSLIRLQIQADNMRRTHE